MICKYRARAISSRIWRRQIVHIMVRKRVHHGKRSQAIGDDPAEESYTTLRLRELRQLRKDMWICEALHYLQLNGFIESCIQTAKNTLTKARESQMDPDMAMLCLRTTPIDHSLPSPSELLYARKLEANLPVKIHNPLNSRDEIQSRLQERQDIQKSYHDKHAHDLPPLMVGQPIRIQDHTSGRWNQAIVNARCYEPRSYKMAISRDAIAQMQETSPARRRVRFADDPAGEMQTLRPTPVDVDMSVGQAVADDANDITHRVYHTRSGRAVSKPKRFDL